MMSLSWNNINIFFDKYITSVQCNDYANKYYINWRSILNYLLLFLTKFELINVTLFQVFFFFHYWCRDTFVTSSHRCDYVHKWGRVPNEYFSIEHCRFLYPKCAGLCTTKSNLYSNIVSCLKLHSHRLTVLTVMDFFASELADFGINFFNSVI